LRSLAIFLLVSGLRIFPPERKKQFGVAPISTRRKRIVGRRKGNCRKALAVFPSTAQHSVGEKDTLADFFVFSRGKFQIAIDLFE